MSEEISIAEVDQAEAALADAKSAFYESGKSEELQGAFADAKRDAVAARRAWRQQEEQAGRRSGFVGGDVTREN